MLVAVAAMSASAMGGYPKMWVYNSYRMSTDDGWRSFSNMVVRAAAAKEVVSACRWITGERPAPKGVRISFDMDAQSLA